MQQHEKDELLRRLTPQPRPIYRLLANVIGGCSTVQDVVPTLMLADPDARVCTSEELYALVEQVEYVIDNGRLLDLQFDSFTSDSRIDLARAAIDYLTSRRRHFIWSSALYSWVDRWREFAEVENEEIYGNLIVAKSYVEGYDPYYVADDYLSSAGRLASKLLESREGRHDLSSWEEEGYLGEGEDSVFPRLEYTVVNGRRR